MEKIKAVFYFTNEWWGKHFFSGHEYFARRSADELDRVYLQRKRFLHECFGGFGIGEETPVMDGKYVNMFVKWGMDIIAYIQGARLVAKEAGGYMPVPESKEVLSAMKPVNIEGTDFADWIVKRKRFLERRYGSFDHMQLLETSMNMASRIRGEEFYIDLGLDKPFAEHLLAVIAETTVMAYRFFCREFNMPDTNLTNCTINHISPEMYEEFFLKNDIYLGESTKDLFPGMEGHVCMHGCDLPGEKYIKSYAKVPHVYRYETSHLTDVHEALRQMPGVHYVAMINPIEMTTMSKEDLRQEVTQKTADGVREWIFWGIDPRCDIQKVNDMIGAVNDACAAIGFEAEPEVIPFNFDELEWSFPKWQGTGIFSINSAADLPVDVN